MPPRHTHTQRPTGRFCFACLNSPSTTRGPAPAQARGVVDVQVSAPRHRHVGRRRNRNASTLIQTERPHTEGRECWQDWQRANTEQEKEQ